MRGKLVSGWYLLLNEKAAKKWLKNSGGFGRSWLPTKYPVLAKTGNNRCRVDYIHPCDAENMHRELSDAVKFLGKEPNV